MYVCILVVFVYVCILVVFGYVCILVVFGYVYVHIRMFMTPSLPQEGPATSCTLTRDEALRIYREMVVIRSPPCLITSPL